MTAPDADLSATLAGIRERSAKAEARQGDSAEWLGAALRSAMEDVPRLLAVFDAVLKLADDWDAEAARLDVKAAQADRTVPRARNESTLISARAQTFEGCGQELRVTIAAALAGPQPGRD